MITIKSKSEMDAMRRAGAIVAMVLDTLEKEVRPGIATERLDDIAEEMIRSKKALPAFKGYQGFPATICTSVNDEVVHGIPGKRTLREGDIIGIDVGVRWDGFFGDAARTLPVGEVGPAVQRLIDVTREALRRGIIQAVRNNRISDISHAVQTYVESQRYGVVRQYVGHGIGSKLHEEPQVPNFGDPGQGPSIRSGMALAIEPMVTEGSHEVKLADDGWTVLTRDHGLSAHFEHTVLVTENGTEILTG